MSIPASLGGCLQRNCQAKALKDPYYSSGVGWVLLVAKVFVVGNTRGIVGLHCILVHRSGDPGALVHRWGQYTISALEEGLPFENWRGASLYSLQLFYKCVLLRLCF